MKVGFKEVKITLVCFRDVLTQHAYIGNGEQQITGQKRVTLSGTVLKSFQYFADILISTMLHGVICFFSCIRNIRNT